MTALQENKLSMYLAVVAVCDKYRFRWSGLPAFSRSYGRFQVAQAQIDSQAQAQGRQSGAGQVKAGLRRTMAHAAAVVAGAVRAYAHEAGDTDLRARVDYSESDLLAGRDSVSAANCQQIHDAAAEHLASLGDHGVDSARLQALQATVGAYRAALNRPGAVRGERKSSTRQLGAAFRAADTELKEQMDELIALFATIEPNFVAEYQAARIIHDQPGGRGPGPDAAAPAPAAKV